MKALLWQNVNKVISSDLSSLLIPTCLLSTLVLHLNVVAWYRAFVTECQQGFVCGGITKTIQIRTSKWVSHAANQGLVCFLTCPKTNDQNTRRCTCALCTASIQNLDRSNSHGIETQAMRE